MTENCCPKCKSALERGFIPDAAYAQVVQLTWHRGAPERATFLGLGNGVKREMKQCLAIAADRCTNCGFLELYAAGGQ